MIRSLILISALFISSVCRADCAGEGLYLYPGTKEISSNPVFILEGYAGSQTVIQGLNSRHNIYLSSGRKKVRLLVIEVCIGQFQLTQAILKPETKLEKGLEYEVHIDSLSQYDQLRRAGYYTRAEEAITYLVSSGEDTVRPVVKGRPELLKKTLVFYGCGPSIHVVFSNPAIEKAGGFVKTTVKSLMSGKEYSYYLVLYDSVIRVGHGMCSGAFDFDEGEDYEIEFSFMDASGNITQWEGKRIRFTRPGEQTSHEDE